jgi:ABC-2 type transport system ATP-binding protein
LGIDDKAEKPVKELSGGEQQRLFIVLALIPDPKVVFLDELTTGLDARARRKVWMILEELKKEGLTILLTSHFMDEVEVLCDEICILKAGRPVFSGSVKEAIRQSPHERFEDAYLWFSDDEGDKDEDIRNDS